ncbi:MAG: GNAT family N-acetyltransferase [Anaerolineae bacterium]|nr:GNAT family N-acetyltransferase [Anaerolineae bacterium]
MIAVIDNYDSFTYNLVQYLGELGAEPEVFRNNAVTVEELDALAPTHVVISPGPGTPDDAGISREVVRKLGPRLPILGVCLGHQCIGEAFGGRVMRAPRLMHGKTSLIQHYGTGLFLGLPKPFEATRYHSLIVEEPLPDVLKATAFTKEGELMGLQHRAYPVFGVQFHPESILTTHGKQLLSNFLAMHSIAAVPSIAIAEATVEDADEVLALQKRAFRSEAERYDDYTLPPLTQTLEGITADFERQHVLKATLKDEIIGSVRGHEEDGTCHVARLVVHPDYQGRGIGSRLVHALESAFAGVGRFEIFTGDRSDPALHLYRKLGYKEFKRKKMDTHDLIYLEKCIEEKE